MGQKQISQDWKEARLKDYVWFQEGPGVRTFQFTGSGIKLLNVRNMVKGKLILSNTIKYLSLDEVNSRYSHFLADENDIVMASSGATWGKTAIVKKKHLPLCMNTSTIRFRPLDEYHIDRKYLLLFLNSQLFKRQIDMMITGGCQPNFGPSHLNKIKFLFPILSDGTPDLEKQKQIVAILEKAEGLKDKGKGLNELFDEYLKSVFYEMFLKNNGKFEEVEIKNIGKVISGSTPKTNNPEFWGGKINWIAPAELVDGHNYFYYETSKKITPKGLKSCSAELFPKGTIMLSTRAPIGKVAIAGNEMCSNQGFKNIIPSEKVNSVYLYFWFLQKKDFLNSLGRGATFKEISKKIVESIKIPLPPIELQGKFASIVEQVEKIKDKLKDEKKDVDELFNALMQKAFSGELI
jgi:type I restriction enzyme S subunit